MYEPRTIARIHVRKLLSASVRLSVGMAVTLSAGPAFAEDASPAQLDVRWTAPPECPSSLELADRVRARVPPGVRIRAQATVEHRASRYLATVLIETPESRGERTLDASTCEELASHVAVVVAVSAIDGAQEGPSRPERANSSPTVQPALPKASSETTRKSKARRPDIVLRLPLITDVGTLPAPSFGAAFALGLARHAWALEVSASRFFAREGIASSSPNRGATFTMSDVALRACLSVGERVAFMPCAGLNLTLLDAEGFGASTVFRASQMLWGPEVLASARFPLASQVSLRAGVAAVVPIERASFVIEGLGDVHTPEVVFFRGWVGPELRI
jgi:hypothetical protein